MDTLPNALLESGCGHRLYFQQPSFEDTMNKGPLDGSSGTSRGYDSPSTSLEHEFVKLLSACF